MELLVTHKLSTQLLVSAQVLKGEKGRNPKKLYEDENTLIRSLQYILMKYFFKSHYRQPYYYFNYEEHFVIFGAINYFILDKRPTFD